MSRSSDRPRRRLLLCVALAAAGLAHADNDDIELAQLSRDGVEFEHAETMRFAAGGMASERVVKGAPYCAEAVHETVQWLADGSGGAPNRIVRQQSTLLCRDGEGRTRQEVQRGNRKLVYLRDPVATESWVLDGDRKTARRLDVRGHAAADGGAWSDYADRMKDWARSFSERARAHPGSPAVPVPPQPPTPPAAPLPPVAGVPAVPPTPVVISRADPAAREVEVNVVRLRSDAAPAGAEWALPPPAVQWRAQSWAPRGAGTVSPLAPRDIEGLRANGERTTWVIDAGKVGNDKPIHITREVWTAPELMITLSSRDFDPRSGEVNYRLKNIRRGEPDATLMRVPPDYKVPPRPGGKATSPDAQG